MLLAEGARCRSSPATARRPPARWTRSRSPHPRPPGPARRARRSGARRSSIARRAQAADRRAASAGRTPPRRWPRWRTSTSRSARSAARARRCPRERGSSRWPSSSCSQDSSDRSGRARRLGYVTAGASRLAEELGCRTSTAALQGARDIIAERVNDDADARAPIRELFLDPRHDALRGPIAGKEKRAPSTRTTSTGPSRIATAPSHRVLADPPRGGRRGPVFSDPARRRRTRSPSSNGQFVNGTGPCRRAGAARRQGRLQAAAALVRWRPRRALESKKRADAAAIDVFAENLRQLLLAPPLGQKRVLAIDPGFRTGCKPVVLDAARPAAPRRRDLPRPGRSSGPARRHEAIKRLVDKHQIEAIAIGNGTGRPRDRGLRPHARPARRRSPS